MTELRTNWQKAGAILVAAILFIIVGLVFAGVGIINHQATIDLQNKVKQQKKELEIKLKLDQVSLKSLEFKTKPKSYLVLSNYKDNQRILAEFNSTSTLPIASITKLMTALVAIENLDLTQKFIATSTYVGGDGTFNILKIGEVYVARELLKTMIIASDNDSARLLASSLGENNFVQLMNNKAKEIGMNQTRYYNVTGLDPLDGSINLNYSSANDIAKLVLYILKNQPEIFQISTQALFNICTIKQECADIQNTNKLLTDNQFKVQIIGTKTGQTDLALKNLALITRPINDIFLVSIILGSSDHFADTKYIFNQLEVKK